MPASARDLRALLLEAVRGSDGAVLAGLGSLSSFRALSTLWQTGWLGGGKRSGRATSAGIRQRLREIGAARRRLAEAALLPAGAVALIEGRVVALSPLDLDDDSGEIARVPAGPIHWIDHQSACQGDRVTLLGFVDRALDPSLPAPGPRQPASRLLLRSAQLPLVAHVFSMLPAGKRGSRKITSVDDR
jgi:hypothetical protein